MRVLMLVVLMATGCLGDGDKTRDISVGEYCDYLGEPFCDRVVECAPDQSWNNCFQNYKKGCCLDAARCHEEVIDTGVNAPLCREAYKFHDCEELLDGVAPRECIADADTPL